MDLMCRHIVQIDFDEGKLRLLSGVGNDLGERIEFLYRPSGVPALATTIGGSERRWFIADTGCASWSFCQPDVHSALTNRGEAELVRPARKSFKALNIKELWRANHNATGAIRA